ncbi:hypothetical protein [Nitrosopumilus sp. S4]
MRGIVLPILFGIIALGLTGITGDAFAEHKANHAPEGGWQDAVASMQTQIDSFFDVFIDISLLNQEIADRQAGDASLQEQIDSFLDSFINAEELLAEQQARDAADQALQDALDAETAARLAEDTQLQSDLASEADARAAADQLLDTLFDSKLVSLGGDIDSEEARAIAAEQELLRALEQEIADRIAADTPLQQKTHDNMMDIVDNSARIDSFFDVFVEVAELDTETADRIAADQALQRALEDAINQEIAARQAADAELAAALQAEIDAHTTADSDLSSSNEIQTLSLSGQTLEISGGNSVEIPIVTGSTGTSEGSGEIQVGGGTPTPYVFDLSRYVIESGPSLVGQVIPIPREITDNFCKDVDGCRLTIAMINWDNQGSVATRDEFLFISETNNLWRFSNNDVNGLDDNSSTQDWNVWDCHFTDAESSIGFNNNRIDNMPGFGLLNVKGGSYSDTLTTCRIIIQD